MPMNVGDLGKSIIAKGFKKLPKVLWIAQSGHTDWLLLWSRNGQFLKHLSILYLNMIISFKLDNSWPLFH